MNAATINAQTWQEVLRFWFDELTPKQWFMSSDELDKTISEKFSALLKTVRDLDLSPPLDAEQLAANNIQSVQEVLAAIIVVDQFSRNIHRGSAKAFSADELGLALSQYLIDGKKLETLSKAEAQFAIMPQMHSESLQSQHTCVRLFTEFNIEGGLPSAYEHLALIEKFSRFPHRNKVLGRQSTEDELAYLKTGKSFGQG